MQGLELAAYSSNSTWQAHTGCHWALLRYLQAHSHKLMMKASSHILHGAGHELLSLNESKHHG
jgi:hypothetical protein